MKSFERMSDAECKAGAGVECATHGQALADCANQRLAQVKAARLMDERSMASARAWQEIANRKDVSAGGGIMIIGRRKFFSFFGTGVAMLATPGLFVPSTSIEAATQENLEALLAMIEMVKSGAISFVPVFMLAE